MNPSRLRLAIALVAALTVAEFAVQLLVVRSRMWPAGAGLTLSGQSATAALSDPPAVAIAQLPDVGALAGQPLRVTRVWPGGTADRAGLAPGAVILAVEDAGGRRVEIGAAAPADPRQALDLWRRFYRLSPRGAVALEVAEGPGGAARRVVVERPAVWSLDWPTVRVWLREYHFAPLAKHVVYTLAALLLVGLGARGVTAYLMTLAFLLMGAADVGLLYGAVQTLPLAGPVLLLYSWIVLPLAFPVVGLAVIYFPRRAPLLDEQRWLMPALWLTALPMGATGVLATLYLLDVDATAGAVAWLASRPWLFGASFVAALAINIGIVVEGIGRYRANSDAVERRRIETVVYTAIPVLVAYALGTGLPLAAGAAGFPFRWPWPVALFLQVVVLLSALGLAYAVAIRRALSPRTVLRTGVQYALARKTLAFLTALPAALLVLALVRQRDQPLSAIVGAQPLFYVTSIALVIAGLRFRDRAERWIDRRFFRAEYDAREILLSLASRVPLEPDPVALVRVVLADLQAALMPESASVMAERDGAFRPLHSLGRPLEPLPSGGGLAQLLRWSDTPLEINLDDEGSAPARLPPPDRAWLASSGAVLLVPIFMGSGDERPLVGFFALGPKRSEETYTSEDRRLLMGIAAQMGVAADVWRLRRAARASSGLATGTAATVAGDAVTAAGIDIGMVVDGKYRVDAAIGQGGMGAVYRARDLRLDRDVALKVVRGELVASPDARDRFRREARLAARLTHPALVTIFDFGTLPGGAAYLVMEYVAGENLRSRLSHGPLPAAEALRLLARVAEGVDAAHRQQVLHRDLKPENVLLPADGSGPRVLDFGVARAMGAAGDQGTQTMGGTVVGTPAYMAPEQMRGEPVDARTDVYSLAVMACEMLTGRLPFGAGTFVDVAVRQASAAPSLDGVPLPPRAATVLQRALSIAREDRPASAADLAAALERAWGD